MELAHLGWGVFEKKKYVCVLKRMIRRSKNIGELEIEKVLLILSTDAGIKGEIERALCKARSNICECDRILIVGEIEM